MCRMLERHMGDKTKAYRLARINEIERIDEATIAARTDRFTPDLGLMKRPYPEA